MEWCMASDSGENVDYKLHQLFTIRRPITQRWGTNLATNDLNKLITRSQHISSSYSTKTHSFNVMLSGRTDMALVNWKQTMSWIWHYRTLRAALVCLLIYVYVNMLTQLAAIWRLRSGVGRIMKVALRRARLVA